jgi:hypothetical protein
VEVRVCGRHVGDNGFSCATMILFATEAFVGVDQVQALWTVGWLGGLREGFKAGREVDDHA